MVAVALVGFPLATVLVLAGVFGQDGEANLGVEPSVIATDGRFRVEVSPEFEVRYVVTSAGEEDAPLVEGRAAGSDDALVIDVPEADASAPAARSLGRLTGDLRTGSAAGPDVGARATALRRRSTGSSDFRGSDGGE